MSRLFQARIRRQNWLYLAVLLFLAVYSGWVRMPLVMLLSFLGLILLIERIIHTCYRVTDDALVIHSGRFRRDKVLPLASIARIDRVRGFCLFGKELNPALLVVCNPEEGNGGRAKEYAVYPSNEADFVRYVTEKRTRLDEGGADGETDEDELID